MRYNEVYAIKDNYENAKPKEKSKIISVNIFNRLICSIIELKI